MIIATLARLCISTRKRNDRVQPPRRPASRLRDVDVSTRPIAPLSRARPLMRAARAPNALALASRDVSLAHRARSTRARAVGATPSARVLARGGRKSGDARVASAVRDADAESDRERPSTSRRFVALAFTLSAACATAPNADAAQRFKEVCDPTADGADCRAKILAEDGLKAELYDSPRSTFKAAATSTNPNLTTYQSDTLAFVDEVEALLAKDVYDPTREKAIAAFQKKSNDWSGKYAPGGSSKMASGRAFYNALNQLAGHFAFNGLAPIPRSRLEVVETNIAKTRELIAEGR